MSSTAPKSISAKSYGKASVKKPFMGALESAAIPTIPPGWSRALLAEGATMTVVFDGVGFTSSVLQEDGSQLSLTAWLKKSIDRKADAKVELVKSKISRRFKAMGKAVPDLSQVSTVSDAEKVISESTESHVLRMSSKNFRAFIRAQSAQPEKSAPIVSSRNGLGRGGGR